MIQETIDTLTAIFNPEYYVLAKKGRRRIIRVTLDSIEDGTCTVSRIDNEDAPERSIDVANIYETKELAFTAFEAAQLAERDIAIRDRDE